MGTDIQHRTFTHDDREQYRVQVRRCLDVFASMLDAFQFDTFRPLTGLEIEFYLVDAAGDPALKNAELLAGLGNPAFQTELAQFNVEVNVPPRLIADDGLRGYEQDVRASIEVADEWARKVDAGLVSIGILPTLTRRHLSGEVLSVGPRYHLLNEQIVAARGEAIAIDIRGPESLRLRSDSIAPEAACTSFQLHLQVAPESFAAFWNASQAIAGVQVALGANSPYLLGRRLWAETRIALFEQATDTRPVELKAQGVRPRVWFGERWITSIFDLFEENVRYFPALLPICDDEDPVAVLRAGGVPCLAELRLHNGTVYRWNRPVYDIMAGRPHLRVENRVLPAGPTVVDMVANAAFYFGLVRALSEQDRPLWAQLAFTTAEENFHVGARAGLDAHLLWPRFGEVPVTVLVLDHLLPLAAGGLDAWGVAPAERDRLLGVVEQRCRTRRNGAWWQTAVVQHLEDWHGMARPEALRAMQSRYVDLMRTNAPVHTWPVT